MSRVLVYRARLPEEARRVVSVSVRAGRSGAGLGVGRLRTPCPVLIRYAAADGQVRRHRGELLAALAPGAGVRVAGCQFDGGEVLVSLRPVGPAARSPGPPAAAVADRFALPFSLQAWGVTAVTGARVWLRFACRARPGALALRGTLRLALETPGGPLRLRIPFLRIFAAPDLPGGLRWSASGRAAALRVHVGPGGDIDGELLLAVRCQGRSAVPAAAEAAGEMMPNLTAIREVTGQIRDLTAEPAGPGCAIVRGAVDLDIYGVDARGASRWAGRVIPFAELLAVADGDRLEATARIERLSHGPAGIRVSLALGVTALRTETLRLDGAQYRAERIVGSASGTVVLTAAPGQPPPAPRAAAAAAAGSVRRNDWEEVSVSPAQPQPQTDHAHHLHLPIPAAARAVTALQITENGTVEAIVLTDRGHLLIQGRTRNSRDGAPAAATAYPVMQDDRWQLRVIVTQEGTGRKTS